MRKFVLLAVIVSMPLVSNASDEDGNFSAHGLSMKSCGTFLTAMNEGNFQQDWRNYNKYLAHIDGYLTAYNSETPDTYSIIGISDMDGAFSWLEKHCEENPLEPFGLALADLTRKLTSSRIKKRPQ